MEGFPGFINNFQDLDCTFINKLLVLGLTTMNWQISKVQVGGLQTRGRKTQSEGSILFNFLHVENDNRYAYSGGFIFISCIKNHTKKKFQ